MNILYNPKIDDLPAYCCPILALREVENPNLGLEIIATATLVSVADERFLVTSKHVTDLANQTRILYPKNKDEAASFSGPLLTTNPDLLSLGPPASNFDLAVYPLRKADFHPRYHFLGRGQIVRQSRSIIGDTKCLATGYPSGKNKTRPKSRYVNSKEVAWEFRTIALDRYSDLGLDPKYHIAVQYDRHVINDEGQKVQPPKMKGMSGGPLWIESGNGYQLAGFTSDQLSEERIVFGTRALIANAAIDQYLSQQAK